MKNVDSVNTTDDPDSSDLREILRGVASSIIILIIGIIHKA